MSDINFNERALNLKNLMIESGVANSNLIKGCSLEEIARVEHKNKVFLPQSYKAFLKYFGHGLGGCVMYDIDITYDKIENLTAFLRREVLIEPEDPPLPEKAFVFSARYNEQFMFFDCDESKTIKPIFYYQVDDEKFTPVDKTIFDILEKQIDLSIKLKNKREEKKDLSKF